MKTCNFCDAWGSAAYPDVREQDLKDQILNNKMRVQSRAKASKFLVYFQAYTNTFSKTERLRQQFSVASEFEDVVGFVVGTRPDCLSDNVFDLWNEYGEKKYLAVELGVQTFDEDQLIWMRRGHTAKKSMQAIERIARKCPRLSLGIHLMFGLKSETDEQIVETAKLVSTLPIDNVKLHNLHVLKDTPLEEEFLRGEFWPISREDYARRVVLFLENLRPDIAVHRLAALASRHDELVAPAWAKMKMENYQFILDEFSRRATFQGSQCISVAEFSEIAAPLV